MSVRQIEALIEFLEDKRELALGHCSRSKEGRSLSKRLWQECAAILNSVSSDCVKKTGDQWRLFYNEYKHRLLKKIKKEKNEHSATGGGPPTPINLTPLQERLYSILGRDVGDPLPGVRHNPLIPVGSEGGSIIPSSHVGVNAVADQGAKNDYGFKMECADIPGPSGSDGPGIPGPSEPDGPGISECMVHFNEFIQEEATEPIAQTSQVETEPVTTMFAEPTGSQTTQPRRQTALRRRRRRRQPVPDNEEDIVSATNQLRALEQQSVQATNRLAAAVEALVARLNEPIKIIYGNSSE